jgi:proteasome alpha subunit
MMLSPYDFNEAINQRRDHAEEGLRQGSPVAGLSLDLGVLLITVRRTQRKVYEVYDRMMLSAVGNQSDIEAVRIGAVDVAHREGYQRSPDDVTAQRLVGFSLSPVLKELFRDQWRAPAVVRAVFAEMGQLPADDAFFTLNYDGEFVRSSRCAAVAGTPKAEALMAEELAAVPSDASLGDAVRAGLLAWAGAWQAVTSDPGGRGQAPDAPAGSADAVGTLAEQLKDGRVEVGLLDRASRRESRFRRLGEEDLTDVVAPLRRGSGE